MNVVTPFIVAAPLSADGRYCSITFDSATNKGGNTGSTFACSTILSFSGSNVATCLWLDAKTIAIYPDFSTAANIQNAITVGSVIRLLSNNNIYSSVCNLAKLNRGCSQAAQQTVFVLGPSDPVKPLVSIKSSQSISSCSPWLIDFTGCTGDGQRGWHSIDVKVTSTDASTNTTGLAGYIKNHFTTVAPLSVPQSFLTMGATYTLSVTLCNIFVDCASSSVSVVITSGSFSAPVVSLIGSTGSAIYARTPVSVNAVAYVVGCGGSTTSVGLSYAWQVLVGSTPMNVGQTIKTSQLSIPSFSLQTSQTYTIQVTATDSNTKLKTTSSSSFTVQTSALVASVSPSTIQLLRAGKSLVISGASSYDPDDPNSDYGYLNYKWTCTGLTLQGRANPTCLLGISNSGASLTVTAGANAINSTALLTLLVTKDTRNATASVKVQVINSSAPQVTIQTSADSVGHVNTANSLLLTGLIDSSYDVACNWAVSSGSLDLNKAALTSLTKQVAGSTPTTFNLYLAGNALSVRSTYVFSLSCLRSAASIAVTTNGPPVGGQYSISPKTGGIEMETVFTASTSQWSDTDLPITYLFGFVSPTTGLISTVQSRSSLTYTTTTLPGGLDSAGNLVNTLVLAYDSLNASAQVNATVPVSHLPASQVNAAIFSKLNMTKGSTNINDIKSVISVASSMISRVNCSGITNSFCSGLNRGPCAATSFSCGACLSGFVGQQGDANTACVSSSSTSAPQQQCNPADCSGHGSCKLYDRNSGLETSSCSVLSSSCYAMCVCSDGFYGTSCGLTAAQIADQQNLRSTLLTSLSTVVENEDTTVETVTNVVSSISGIVQSQNDVNSESIGTFASIAQTTLNQATTQTTITADAFKGLMGPTDAAINAQAASAGPGAALALGNSILTSYSTIVNRDAAPGVPANSLLYSNFRYSQQSIDISEKVSLKIPQTDAESSTNSPATQLSVVQTGNSGGNVTTVNLALTQFSANLLNISQSKYSSIVSAQFSASSMDHMVLLQLPNTAGKIGPQASDTKPVNFTTHCKTGDRGTYTHVCAGSDQVLTHTCHGIKGNLISYCPVIATLCNSVNLTDGSVGVAISGYTCAVSNMTVKYITCKCYPDNNNRRRLDASAILTDTGVVTALAMADYTANEVGETFQAAPDLTSPQAIERALIVIVMFCVLWAGGLLLITGCFIRQRQLRQETLEKKLDDAGKNYQKSENTSIEEIRERLTKYVDSVFPVIFYPGHLLLRLKDEIRRNHRYLMMFMLLDGELEGKKRYINGIQLLTIQSALMFLLALLYDIQQPTDDGTCVAYTTSATCLDRKSIFDSSRSYCVWTDTPATGSTNCAFNDADVSFQATVYIQVIVSVMSALIMRPLYYLFDVLLAPNVDNMKAKLAEEAALKSIENVGANRQSMVGRMTRRVGRVANSVASMIKFAQPKQVDPKELENMPVTLIPDEVEMVHTEAKAYFRKLTQRAQAYSDGANPNPNHHDAGRKSLRFTVMKKIQTTYAEYVGKVESEHKEAAEKKWEELQQLILQQRSLLQPEEVAIFDGEWGLDPATGQFLTSVASDKTSKDVAKVIQKELALVERDANETIERLHLAVDSHIGFELLQKFILDILGRDTPSARIFANKMEEDFVKTSVKTRREKIIAAVIIFAANALFIYYSILRGYVQGVSWQKSYLIACLVQMMLEIYLFETIECLWINVFVPSLVSSEVQRVNTLLLGIINDLCNKANMGQKLGIDEVDDEHPLDVTRFLFTSTRVARAHPTLMESMMVRSFHTHLPGELARKWTKAGETKVTKGGWFHVRHHRENLSLPVAMVGSVLLTLQIAAMTPFDLQKMFIRFVQPFLYGGLILLGQKIVSSPIYIAVTVIVLVLIAALLFYQYWRYENMADDTRMAKIQPISPVPLAEEAKPFPHVATLGDNDAAAKKKEMDYLKMQRENLRQKASAWAISESKSSDSDSHSHSKEYNIRTVETTHRRINSGNKNKTKGGVSTPKAVPVPNKAATSTSDGKEGEGGYHQWESSEEKSEMGGKDSYLFSSSESPSKATNTKEGGGGRGGAGEETEEDEDFGQLHKPKGGRGGGVGTSQASSTQRGGELESYTSLSLDDSYHPVK